MVQHQTERFMETISLHKEHATYYLRTFIMGVFLFHGFFKYRYSSTFLSTIPVPTLIYLLKTFFSGLGMQITALPVRMLLRKVTQCCVSNKFCSGISRTLRCLYTLTYELYFLFCLTLESYLSIHLIHNKTYNYIQQGNFYDYLNIFFYYDNETL